MAPVMEDSVAAAGAAGSAKSQPLPTGGLTAGHSGLPIVFCRQVGLDRRHRIELLRRELGWLVELLEPVRTGRGVLRPLQNELPWQNLPPAPGAVTILLAKRAVRPDDPDIGVPLTLQLGHETDIRGQPCGGRLGLSTRLLGLGFGLGIGFRLGFGCRELFLLHYNPEFLKIFGISGKTPRVSWSSVSIPRTASLGRSNLVNGKFIVRFIRLMLEAERFDTRYKFGNTFFENHQFGIFLLGRGDIGFGFLKSGIGIPRKTNIG